MMYKMVLSQLIPYKLPASHQFCENVSTAHHIKRNISKDLHILISGISTIYCMHGIFYLDHPVGVGSDQYLKSYKNFLINPVTVGVFGFGDLELRGYYSFCILNNI